jgi:hypothetical protein
LLRNTVPYTPRIPHIAQKQLGQRFWENVESENPIDDALHCAKMIDWIHFTDEYAAISNACSSSLCAIGLVTNTHIDRIPQRFEFAHAPSSWLRPAWNTYSREAGTICSGFSLSFLHHFCVTFFQALFNDETNTKKQHLTLCSSMNALLRLHLEAYIFGLPDYMALLNNEINTSGIPYVQWTTAKMYHLVQELRAAGTLSRVLSPVPTLPLDTWLRCLPKSDVVPVLLGR